MSLSQILGALAIECNAPLVLVSLVYFSIKSLETRQIRGYLAIAYLPFLRGLPLSTSAPSGGGGPKIDRFWGQTVLQKCGQGGGGHKKSKNFADVLNGSPLNKSSNDLRNKAVSSER